MLKPAKHHGRQQSQRLAEGPGHQEGDDGDFGDVELEIAHHTLERGVRNLDVGEVDAAVLSDPVPQDPRLKPVIPEPQAAAADWHRRKGALQVNHLVCVKSSLTQEIVDEVFDLLSRSKSIAGEDPDSPYDTSPFGLEENRRNLEVAIDYVFRQGLIPTRYTVDELVAP